MKPEETDLKPLIIINQLLLKADNNLDKADNLNELPQAPAVYAIFGRINNEPANCRYVGQCNDLQQAIKEHFSQQEKDDCLRMFMQSIKIKVINYELMQGNSETDRMDRLKEWRHKYEPKCNEELNKVY